VVCFSVDRGTTIRHGTEKRERKKKRKRKTYPEHSSHPKALDLFETPKGFLDQTFDERVERSIEERRNDFADSSVHANEVH
jgi:hypothetical protein